MNVKYGLCANCNSIRLSGKTLSQRAVESSTKYRKKAAQRLQERVATEGGSIGKQTEVRVKKAIRQQTNRESLVKAALSGIKRDIELEAIQNGEYYCKGCGKGHVGLDKSHILSVGRFKQYELVKRNIQLLCRTCHVIWESGDIDQQIGLICFVDNLQFINSVEPMEWQKFVTRMEDYKNWLMPGKDDAIIHSLDKALANIGAN